MTRHLTRGARWFLTVCAATAAALGTACTPVSATFAADPAPADEDTTVWEIEAEVLRIIDGDTIAVAPIPGVLDPNNDAGTEHSVRLLGIDTPEMNYRSDAAPECGAQEATDHLEQILHEGQTVLLVWDAYADHTDRYGRSLAYVHTTATATGDVGNAQILGGYAIPYVPRGEPRPEMIDLYDTNHAAAIEEGTGPLIACSALNTH